MQCYEMVVGFLSAVISFSGWQCLDSRRKLLNFLVRLVPLKSANTCS